jgi:hypothetical protein
VYTLANANVHIEPIGSASIQAEEFLQFQEKMGELRSHKKGRANGTRKSLVLSAEALLLDHDKICDPDSPLVLGPFSEFVDDRDPDRRYPFDMILCLIIHCPGDCHAEVALKTISEIKGPFAAVPGIGDYLCGMMSPRRTVTNHLQCHTTFGKEDDGSLHLYLEQEYSGGCFPL